MKVLGITGGVGAGKSTVLNYLEEKYGARVVQADLAAHLLMEPGQFCHTRITETFGTAILREDRTIDRGKLGAIVFADKEKLEQLNAIVHPAVKSYIAGEIENERKKGSRRLFVVEAALLIEDHYEEVSDELWYIHTDRDVRRKRIMETRGYSREKADNIMKNQLSEEMFRKFCQFTVDNSSDILENTYEQIDKGLKEHEFL